MGGKCFLVKALPWLWELEGSEKQQTPLASAFVYTAYPHSYPMPSLLLRGCPSIHPLLPPHLTFLYNYIYIFIYAYTTNIHISEYKI